MKKIIGLSIVFFVEIQQSYTAFNRHFTDSNGLIHAEAATGPGIIWVHADHFRYGTIQ